MLDNSSATGLSRPAQVAGYGSSPFGLRHRLAADDGKALKIFLARPYPMSKRWASLLE